VYFYLLARVVKFWICNLDHNRFDFNDANIIATLALGLWPRQGFAKVWAKTGHESHISCSRKCKRVWGNEPSHFQVNSHFGSWSPDGLLNFQRAIAGVKIHWIKNFLISLKRSWNVDVWNGLTWLIWTPETQKKGRESNWQFDSRPLKVWNRLDFLMCRWRAIYY
jgi:hypothetical protein